jgi:IS605 OrfB family transposase
MQEQGSKQYPHFNFRRQGVPILDPGAGWGGIAFYPQNPYIILVSIVQKVIILNPLELTGHKSALLNASRSQALGILQKHILPILDEVEDKGELQKRVYHNIRNESTLHCQVVLNLIRNSISLKEKPPEKRDVKRMTLDCNIPRAGKVFTLESGTYCVKLNLAKGKSIVVPIARNRMLQRYEANIANGWKLKQMSITANNRILAVIEKRKAHIATKNVLGIDINSNNLALTIITPKGKILKQTYLGYGVWRHKAKILSRKSKLQRLSKKSCRAKGKLKLLRRRLRNFTRNNTGELSKEIHEIALEYNAKIVMERLTKFSANKGRNANRKISLIPFRLLQERIAVRSVDTGVPLGYVDPYHTSMWCPRCGSVNPSHNKKIYAIYRCSKCGLIMNSDRKASLAIAVKKLAERKHDTHQSSVFQISAREVPVNGLYRRNEEVTPIIDSVNHGLSPTKAPSAREG